MSIGIPKTLKIGPHTLEVRIQDNHHYDRGQMAQVHTGLHVIWLEKRQTETMMWDGIWHEVLEMINTLYDLNLEHHKLTVIACQMHQFWAQNLREQEIPEG